MAQYDVIHLNETERILIVRRGNDTIRISVPNLTRFRVLVQLIADGKLDISITNPSGKEQHDS